MAKVEVTDQLIDAMQMDRDNGVSIQKIAKRHGVSYNIVQRYTRNPDSDGPWEIRLGWAAEWNAARFRILGAKQ